MRIIVISDLHVDINQNFPFSFKGEEKEIFTLIAGDVSGNVKLTSKWVKQNIKHGILVAGNHDPTYNDLGWTIQTQKEYLHKKFPETCDVTFLDEQVGVMSKEIPGTNILVIGSTLYTDYKYASDNLLEYISLNNKWRKEGGESEMLTVEGVNMGYAIRGLNDFRWGHVPDEFDDRGLSQRPLRPMDLLKWFNVTFAKIKELVELNENKDVIVLTHHCPSPMFISSRYVNSNMNASYVSELEGFINEHRNIKAWCCGHVHNVNFFEIGNGKNKHLMVCNPRGYEHDFESEKWNPNTFIDTDSWKVVVEPYSNPKLEQKRKEAHDKFMKYAPFFM